MSEDENWLPVAFESRSVPMSEAVAMVDRGDAVMILWNVGPSLGAKPDEHALWRAMLDGETPRAAGERLGIPAKRVQRICEKWASREIYDYGVTCDLGWPTDPAQRAYREIRLRARVT